MDPKTFMAMQQWPYKQKVTHAVRVAQEFYGATGGKVYCSVGGLDSITLLTFLRTYVSKDIPGASASSLEDKSIQAVHRSFENFVYLKPLKTKVQVITECGYPIISKEKAAKIEMVQNPTERNKTVRHAVMTGETGKLGGFTTKATGSRMQLPLKWLQLFGGPENERYGTNYQTAPFRVSTKCCYWLKEKPADNYARETGRFPYMGLMASEGGRREKILRNTGCNYYTKSTTRSCPFAIFSRTDLLQLALDLDVPVPEIYGRIERREDGSLETTKARRTGCTMCGFGIHIEQRPHRFDRLRETSPKEWDFWLYRMGWGRVLDYIGVEWEEPPRVQERLL